MIRASLDLVVLGLFAAVVIAWCDQGSALVLLSRIAGW